MTAGSRPIVDIATGCACGAVSLWVAGAVKSMFMRACRDCQKASGTGHSTVAAFATADVTATGPVQGFERPAASGATTTRYFCPGWGTPLFARSSRAPALTLVPVGLLDGAAWFAPNQLIFARSHGEWDTLPSGLPRHATYREVTP